jgi:hypothetical protein
MEKILSINEIFKRNDSSYREYLDNCKYFKSTFAKENNLVYKKSKENELSVL